MPPEQTVQTFRDVRGKRLFPVHWSTFNLAYRAWGEPVRRTAAEARRTGVELVTPRSGKGDADREFRSTAWWEAVR
jgi:L-ascorbate metabolism protein UlaG (beta-lactamase superfamily)